MIKKIIFTKKEDLNNENTIELEFDKHINVIIGPKGGGKSTLFDLLAGIKNNYISKNVEDALDSNGFKFIKAIKFNNEEINANQLIKKTEKEKKENYKNRNDVIYQDDDIKKNLTNAKDVEKAKYDYTKKQVEQSKSVKEMIVNIKKLYDLMNKVNSYNDAKNAINWTNTFKMNQISKDDKLKLITSLDYRTFNMEQIIENEEKYLKKFLYENKNYLSTLEKVKLFEFDSNLKNIEFEKELINNVNEAISINEKINKNIINRIKYLLSIKNAIHSFDYAYKKIINKIKEENFEGSGLKNYEMQAKNHFKNLANDVFELITSFESLVREQIILNFENNNDQEGSLTYKVNESIKLEEGGIVETLKIVFHPPRNSINDVTKWLKSLMEKGIKEFDENELNKKITKILNKTTQVLADGKNYETMSLGQKSIYGFKYKFNKSIEEDLFLDQPEDNLDNNTIANEILKMIEQKNNQQIIIVTHNANIGILTKPEKVIVANLSNKDNPYSIGKIKKDNEDSDSAHYLEGGSSFLEGRYKIVVKGE